MGNKGKAGCGCLIGILIIIMVLAGALMHPMSLKFIAKQFTYADKIVKADAVFVPRFAEDRGGSLYAEAFREYFAGNAKLIYIEDDDILGMKVSELVSKMAKARGVRENIIRAIDPGIETSQKGNILKEKLKITGNTKVIVLVPEYASRRYRDIFNYPRDETIYMIKPVQVPYFQKAKWWHDPSSRSLVAREFSTIVTYYYETLRNNFSRKYRKE